MRDHHLGTTTRALIMAGLGACLALIGAAGCGDSGDTGTGGDAIGGAVDAAGPGGAAGADLGGEQLPGNDGGTDGPSDGSTELPDDGLLDPPAAQGPSRAVHRMTVEQLMASIPIVTGGLAWEEDFGAGPQNMLEQLAPTLGAPDYVLVTEENLEPSMIIAKFMADASNRVCAKWVQRDRAADPGERTLITHDDWSSLDQADVKTSLRRLMLRFFSRYVSEDDDAAVAPLYGLFVAASSGAPAGKAADDGWLAVCMGLMNDPEFVLY